MTKRKILFVTGTLGQGGAQRRTLYLINEIIKYNVEVFLVLQSLSGSYMPLLSSQCKALKLVGFAVLGSIVRLISFIIILNKTKPNVIYTNLWGTCFLVRKALLFYRRPVEFIYGISNTLDVYTAHRQEFEETLKDEDVVLILQSERIKEEVLLYRGSETNIHVIPNVIDPDLVSFKGSAIKHRISNGAQLVHVGRIVRQKRHDRLLRIAQELKMRGVHFQLDLIGDGPLRHDMSTMCRKMELQESVIFRGYQDNPFIWIRNADVMLLTSDYEGMPMVLIEALTLGTPVVSTDVEFGPREIIKNGVNGFITPKDDVEAFVSCVITVLNEKKVFSERARMSSSRFYVQNHIKRYLRVMGVI